MEGVLREFPGAAASQLLWFGSRIVRVGVEVTPGEAGGAVAAAGETSLSKVLSTSSMLEATALARPRVHLHLLRLRIRLRHHPARRLVARARTPHQ
jgi:hypothetical protein